MFRCKSFSWFYHHVHEWYLKNATVITIFRAYGANLTFLQVPRVRVQLPTHAAAADTTDAPRLTPGSLLALPAGV